MKTWMWLLLFGAMLIVVPQQALAQHHNDLSWNQSTCVAPCAVTGNNVYRTKTTGTGYVKILTSPTPVTSYSDFSVLGNDIWFYVATATCVTCSPTESGFSNEIKATTPGNTPPGAPGTLTVVSQ